MTYSSHLYMGGDSTLKSVSFTVENNQIPVVWKMTFGSTYTTTTRCYFKSNITAESKKIYDTGYFFLLEYTFHFSNTFRVVRVSGDQSFPWNASSTEQTPTIFEIGNDILPIKQENENIENTSFSVTMGGLMSATLGSGDRYLVGYGAISNNINPSVPESDILDETFIFVPAFDSKQTILELARGTVNNRVDGSVPSSITLTDEYTLTSRNLYVKRY